MTYRRLLLVNLAATLLATPAVAITSAPRPPRSTDADTTATAPAAMPIDTASCAPVAALPTDPKGTDTPPTSSGDTASASNDLVPLSQFIYAGTQRYTLDGSPPRLTSDIKPLHAAVVGGLYAGLLIGLHIHQQNAWWKDERGPFHFQEDWTYALQADKAGHWFAGYYMSYLLGEGLMASGFSWESATIWGGTLGFLYQTYVETEDGFGTRWGFSPSDEAADFIGAGYYIAQHYVPVLQNFTPKWQFIPARWQNERPIPHPTAIVDDYNSSIFWLSVNVHNLLPENLQRYWLPWLNIAVGYGARDIGYDDPALGPDFTLPSRRYVVALDYDLTKLLPEGGNFWNWIRQSLNYIKFPAPAIEFGARTRFYLLYPFKFDLGGVSF